MPKSKQVADAYQLEALFAKIINLRPPKGLSIRESVDEFESEELQIDIPTGVLLQAFDYKFPS